MAVESSSIFTGFKQFLPREQKTLNAIPVAAVASDLLTAFLQC